MVRVADGYLGEEEQPPAIIQRYGQFGENLTGPNVTTAGEFKRVEVVTTVEL